MNLIEDFLYEDLEVPQECVESLKVYDKYLNIKLSPTVRFFNDDWYVRGLCPLNMIAYIVCNCIFDI